MTYEFKQRKPMDEFSTADHIDMFMEVPGNEEIIIAIYNDYVNKKGKDYALREMGISEQTIKNMRGLRVK